MTTDDNMMDTTNKDNAPKKRAPRKKPQVEGLGDAIDKVTTATGIKKVVKAVVGEDCGCEERRDRLNKKYPFLRDARMDEKQKGIWNNIIVPGWKRGRLEGGEASALTKLFLDFGISKPAWRRCGSCAKKALQEMQAVYEASCEKN